MTFIPADEHVCLSPLLSLGFLLFRIKKSKIKNQKKRRDKKKARGMADQILEQLMREREEKEKGLKRPLATVLEPASPKKGSSRPSSPQPHVTATTNLLSPHPATPLGAVASTSKVITPTPTPTSSQPGSPINRIDESSIEKEKDSKGRAPHTKKKKYFTRERNESFFIFFN